MSQGILIREDIAADKTLVCLWTPPWLVRSLSPLWIAGHSDGKVVWSINDAKVILHELAHMLFNLPHNGRGLMFPMAEFSVFATGFSDDELREIKK